MTADQISILLQAINKYGINNQLDMATEECAELIQAINKLKRKNILDNGSIRKPSQSTNLTAIVAFNSLCSEVADVKIMIAQLEMMLCKETIQISVDRKIERLRSRLNN